MCNGITLRSKKDQTRLEDTVSQFGYTVNIVDENALILATAIKNTKYTTSLFMDIN
jgi:hypothetical protein